MKPKTYKALTVFQTEDNRYDTKISEKSFSELPEGDTVIAVHYSSLNYKDLLSTQGNKGVTRSYPHTPGIDAAGVIVESQNSKFSPGDPVIVTGYDLGMNTSGGFAQFIRVPSSWVVPCPKNLDLRTAMLYGTAGFTAALSVYSLTQAVNPQDGEILVTGATGGVGSVSVSILSHLGYRVIGATGKPAEKDFLLKLGAQDIIDRQAIDDDSKRPLLKTQWAGVIDTVGGNTLSTALKSTLYGGRVTCCGNVGGPDFFSSVYPFILRGVSLIGIDSVQCPMPLRETIWEKLSDSWQNPSIFSGISEVALENLPEQLSRMANGQHVGRTVVNLLD